jgi:hypothetical protein
MATSGGGFAASGLLQGFAQAYNSAYQRRTQQDLEQRHQLAGALATMYPNARPEAQQDIAQRLLSIYSTPIGKKLDKKLGDVSTLGQGAMQQQAQAGQAGAAQSQAGLQQGMTAPPVAPPPGVEPQVQPTPQGAIPQQAPAIPAPPPYSPFLSPQEKNQQEAARITAQTEAQTTAQVQSHLQAYDQWRATHPTGTMQEFLAASGRSLGVGALTPRVLGHNIAGKDLLDAHPDITTIGGEQLDPAKYYDLSSVGGQPVAVPAGLGAQVALSNIAGTPFKSFVQQKMAEGMSREDANTLWNTTQSTQHGFKSEPQPDGSIKMVPVTTTTTKTKGSGIPAPPSASGGTSAAGPGAGTPGRTVGGKIPPEVVKAQSTYLQSIERYNVMSSALPKALAGDQQAMINLLYNHIGMTVGLQKGARITRDIISEAQTSAPWMATLLARIGVGKEFTMTPDALRGVVIPPETMHNMIGLAEDRVSEDYNQLNAQKQAYATGRIQTPEQVKAGGQQRQSGKPLSQTAPPKQSGPPSGATHIGTSKRDGKDHYLDASGKDLGVVQ